MSCPDSHDIFTEPCYDSDCPKDGTNGCRRAHCHKNFLGNICSKEVCKTLQNILTFENKQYALDLEVKIEDLADAIKMTNDLEMALTRVAVKETVKLKKVHKQEMQALHAELEKETQLKEKALQQACRTSRKMAKMSHVAKNTKKEMEKRFRDQTKGALVLDDIRWKANRVQRDLLLATNKAMFDGSQQQIKELQQKLDRAEKLIESYSEQLAQYDKLDNAQVILPQVAEYDATLEKVIADDGTNGCRDCHSWKIHNSIWPPCNGLNCEVLKNIQKSEQEKFEQREFIKKLIVHLNKTVDGKTIYEQIEARIRANVEAEFDTKLQEAEKKSHDTINGLLSIRAKNKIASADRREKDKDTILSLRVENQALETKNQALVEEHKRRVATDDEYATDLRRRLRESECARSRICNRIRSIIDN